MRRLLALIRKEVLVLCRDVHALASLFLMPVLFIIIMSMALKDVYKPPLRDLPYALELRDKGEIAAELVTRWRELRGPAQALPADPAEALRSGRLRYLIVIEADFSEVLRSPQSPSGIQARVIVDPALDISVLRATEAELAALVGELRAEALQERFTGISRKGSQSIRLLVSAERLALGVRPNSVQQNVPAWLIFGMFFVLTAMANLIVQEHDNGTLARLRTLGIAPGILLLSKGLPYLAVNAVQAALMLAVGAWLMPLLGGDGLSLQGVHWGALLLMLAATACAAVGMSLALASVLRSHAQASSIGPILNVLLAAIGGVMVPRFVMPPLMQDLAAYSPMNWSLEGLLAVLLRHAGPAEILPQALSLCLFGACMLLAAIFLFKRRMQS
jgi:ABC-2 type transport system permease protein